MEPAEVEVTESEAHVMGPEGVGWGLVLEEPPPGELDDTGECPLDGLPSCEGEEPVASRSEGDHFFYSLSSPEEGQCP
jgi:hypothetical protein